jgi:hypothetical protein
MPYGNTIRNAETSKQFEEQNNAFHLTELPPIFNRDQPITYTREDMVSLGITLDYQLRFDSHTKILEERTCYKMRIIRKMSTPTWNVSKYILRTIWSSWIAPGNLYGVTSWCTCSPHFLKRLDKLQYQAARIIVGASQYASRLSVLEEANIATIQRSGIQLVAST